MVALRSAADKLMDLCLGEPNSGCWLWIGCLDEDGYGKFHGDIETLAHRESYRVFVGPIPAGKEIDHLCKVRCCINPRHLEAVTRRINIDRSDRKTGHYNSKKTHCKAGHEFTPENTRTESHRGVTMRKCRACRRDRMRTKRKAA